MELKRKMLHETYTFIMLSDPLSAGQVIIKMTRFMEKKHNFGINSATSIGHIEQNSF